MDNDVEEPAHTDTLMIFTVRLSPNMRKLLDTMAWQDYRSSGNLLRYLIYQEAIKRGLIDKMPVTVPPGAA